MSDIPNPPNNPNAPNFKVLTFNKPAPDTNNPNNPNNPDTNTIIIGYLTEALELAKLGVIQDLSLVAIKSNGDVMSAWSAPYNRFSILGGMDYLKTRILNSIQISPNVE